MPLPCSFVQPTNPFITAQPNGSKTIVSNISLCCFVSQWMVFFKGQQLSSYQYTNSDNEWNWVICIVDCISLRHYHCWVIVFSSLAGFLYGRIICYLQISGWPKWVFGGWYLETGQPMTCILYYAKSCWLFFSFFCFFQQSSNILSSFISGKCTLYSFYK